MAVPTAVGSNVSVTVSTCPGFKLTGNVTADEENPLPVTAMEFTVTAAVPLEVNVNVCVVGVFTVTAPNAMLDALALSFPVAAFNCSDTDFDVLPAVAVTVAVCALVTVATFAVKVALVAVAGTVTEEGTITALLLLPRPTLTPPEGAAPDRLTVHKSASDPVIEVLLHETPLTVGITVLPVPLKPTVAVEALLAIVNCPVAVFAVAGAN